MAQHDRHALERKRASLRANETMKKNTSFGRITHLLLGNFKAFRRMQRIPIRPITLIYGRNNSGKSSIIQAIQWAQEVRRTGDHVPRSVGSLEGGLSQLVHGKGRFKAGIEFGWEWTNPDCSVGLNAGRILNHVESERYVSVQAELNGEQFFDLSDEDDNLLWAEPNTQHPVYTKFLLNLQKWLALDLGTLRQQEDVSSELREVLGAAGSALEQGEFRAAIESNLFRTAAGLRYFANGFVPRFSFCPEVEDSYECFNFSREGWRMTQLDEETRERSRYGETRKQFVDKLLQDLRSHIASIISQHGAYFLYRWVNEVWEHFAQPLDLK
ncbi:MAG: AAA family ATPase [Verrucomicrobiota bacterium]|nr:AAA family ATPase [Verrucomicrobiota bacterium]